MENIKKLTAYVITVLILFLAIFLTHSLVTANDGNENNKLKEYKWLWDYNHEIHDVTVEALLGSKTEFENWKTVNKPVLNGYFDKVSIPKPKLRLTDVQINDRLKLTKIEFRFPNGFIENDIIEGLLATSKKPSSTCKPVIVAISGHEVSPWGKAPYDIFKSNGWGFKFVEAGYTVYAPANVFYKELSSYWPKHDYYIVWTEIQCALFELIRGFLPANSKYAVVGLSSGASVGAFFMMRTPEIGIGVFAGILTPLDYKRENYRIKNHPHNFDIRFLYSYVPLYSLIAPRPVQFQMGRLDGWYPKTMPTPPKSNWFPGTPRGVSSEEMVGEYLLINEIWKKYGKSVSLTIHDGGHVINFSEAENFISANFCN